MYRERWAKDGTRINDLDDPELDMDAIDTLDMIPSMKDQFAEMYKKASTKSARKKLHMRDNTKITDFFNQNVEKTPAKNLEVVQEEEKEAVSQESKIEFTITPNKLKDDDSILSDDFIKELEAELEDEDKFDIKFGELESPLELDSPNEENAPKIKFGFSYKFKFSSPTVSTVKDSISNLPKESPYSKKMYYTSERDLITHYSNKVYKDNKTKTLYKRKFKGITGDYAQLLASK